MSDRTMSDRYGPGAVALVGMAGRFPGAPNVDALWRNLRNGVESVRRISREEARRAGVASQEFEHADYVPFVAEADGLDRFDPGFFGYLPREAEIMDPQHRQVLECAWEALENAGYDASRYSGRIGVFAGVARNTYLLEILRRDPGYLERIGEYEGLIGGEKDFPATRIAYKLDLRGPCVNVQTACSTSGVAVHLACQSLLSGESDMILAGGGRVLAPTGAGYRYQSGGILSPDGHCRAFDAEARGTIRGSGVAFVVLKRLEDALADGDTIRAVIRGTAVNNDGAAKAGFTAPGVRGQADAVAEALAVAGVSAQTVGYVECHGTGTPLGDPIEISALTRAFRQTTDGTGYCAIGSVKTNIGHLDAGAAVTGLIKAALCLDEEEIPPSLHFEAPNPQIDFENSPFFVNAELRPWPRGSTPRRAGVSSFGLGGTNFHAVLEEGPGRTPVARVPVEGRERADGRAEGRAAGPEILPISARTPQALDRATENLVRHLDALDRPDGDEGDTLLLRDVAYTLQTGRRAFPHRRTVVAPTAGTAARALSGELPGHEPRSGRIPATERPVVFMFPGGGAQHVAMGRELHARLPVYRRTFDRCLETLETPLAAEIRRLTLDADPSSERARAVLERPSHALPALFATEYALARTLEAWGLGPAAALGHSVSEYVAACLAGVFELPDAMEIVRLRGALFEELPAGAMTAVPLAATEVERLGAEGVSVAVINRADSCVVSGPVGAVRDLESRLQRERDIDCRRLHIDVAAHSPMIDGILERFREGLQEIEFSSPTLPLLSTVTGSWAQGPDIAGPDYWVRHLRNTVQFEPALSTLLAWSPALLLEVGPGHTLSSFARFHPGFDEGHATVTTMRHPTEKASDVEALFDALGRAWIEGAEVDWSALWRDRGEAQPRRVPLPTYPFARERHWAEVLDEPTAAAPEARPSSGVASTADAEAAQDAAATRAAAAAPDGTAGTAATGASAPAVPATDTPAPTPPAEGRDRPDAREKILRVVRHQMQVMERQLSALGAARGEKDTRSGARPDPSKSTRSSRKGELPCQSR